jgi:hypothetical protein
MNAMNRKWAVMHSNPSNHGLWGCSPQVILEMPFGIRTQHNYFQSRNFQACYHQPGNNVLVLTLFLCLRCNTGFCSLLNVLEIESTVDSDLPWQYCTSGSPHSNLTNSRMSSLAAARLQHPRRRLQGRSWIRVVSPCRVSSRPGECDKMQLSKRKG